MSGKKNDIDRFIGVLRAGTREKELQEGVEPGASFRENAMRSIRRLSRNDLSEISEEEIGYTIWRAAGAAVAFAVVVYIIGNGLGAGDTGMEFIALDSLDYLITEPILL